MPPLPVAVIVDVPPLQGIAVEEAVTLTCVGSVIVITVVAVQLFAS